MIRSIDVMWIYWKVGECAFFFFISSVCARKAESLMVGLGSVTMKFLILFFYFQKLDSIGLCHFSFHFFSSAELLMSLLNGITPAWETWILTRASVGTPQRWVPVSFWTNLARFCTKRSNAYEPNPFEVYCSPCFLSFFLFFFCGRLALNLDERF